MTPNKKNVFGMGEVTADEMLDHLIKEIDKELEKSILKLFIQRAKECRDTI